MPDDGWIASGFAHLGRAGGDEGDGQSDATAVPDATRDAGAVARYAPAGAVPERVAQVVGGIPAGAVMTYGDVAAVVGTGARQVGRIMATGGLDVPWWRVTNATGSLPEHLRASADAHYREEGTPVRSGRVDLRRARWRPAAD